MAVSVRLAPSALSSGTPPCAISSAGFLARRLSPSPPSHLFAKPSAPPRAQEVDRQIRLIAEFVELEAREKSAEIRARAKADADAERQIALVNAREKLGEEFDRKEKALGVELKMCVGRPQAPSLPAHPRHRGAAHLQPPPPATLPPPLPAAMPPWPRRASAAACWRRASST